MKINTSFRSKWFPFIQVILILSWLTNLTESYSYFFTNGLIAFAGVICVLDNQKNPEVDFQKLSPGMIILSAVFALAVVLANYDLFEPYFSLMSIFNVMISMLGGFTIAMNLLLCLVSRLPVCTAAQEKSRQRPVRFFFCCFLSVAAIDLFYLFFAAYPGILTADSMEQMHQIHSGIYNNLNPFWHTQLMRLFIQPIKSLTGSYQTGVAAYSVFQILLMAAAFAYVLVTLYQRQFPKWCLILVWAFYALVPYNIVYSVTLWKDIPFSLACLFMTVSLYRLLGGMQKSRTQDTIVFLVSSLSLCVWRTNGILVYVTLLLAMVLIPSFRKWKLLAAMTAVLAVGCMMHGPVLDAMGVSGGDYVETLSIPLQQVARVVHEDRALEDEEWALIETISDRETISQAYQQEISDPIKKLVRASEAEEAIKNDPVPYIQLWLRLGFRYPGDYLKAWIDQTKGYWNGGYFYWIIADGVYQNDLGITEISGNNLVGKLFRMYLRYSQIIPFFQPLLSIGLFSWMMVVCCYIIRKKGRKEWILALPSFAILIGLMVGTPVYSEFRYAYPVIISCPLILSVTCFGVPDEEGKV